MCEDGRGSSPPPFVPIVVGILEIIKAGVWPLSVLLIFSFLYGPLSGFLNKLPEVIGRADVISIGDFKVELTKALELDATPEVRKAVSSLVPKSARRLLYISLPTLVCKFQHDVASYENDLATDRQLESIGLVSIEDRPPDNTNERSNCYMVELTELGRLTQSFLIDFLASSLGLPKT